ncbi:MAG: hypothetical protein AAFR21_08360 [Pseudomonadota bacterium]
MSSERSRIESSPVESFSGYLASALVFAVITGLWVFLVSEDDFYQRTQVFGLELPITTVFYLATMPALGYLAGRWRFYHTSTRKTLSPARILARSFQFIYSHILIVLFTAAMVTRTLLDWNIDGTIQQLDDQLFVMASRFAPWLSAYMTGFNLGRALGIRSWSLSRRRSVNAINTVN